MLDMQEVVGSSPINPTKKYTEFFEKFRVVFLHNMRFYMMSFKMQADNIVCLHFLAFNLSVNPTSFGIQFPVVL